MTTMRELEKIIKKGNESYIIPWKESKSYKKNFLPNKKRWVKALRSGEYKQTRSALYDGTGYCCLGVYQKVTGCRNQEGTKALEDHNFISKGHISEYVQDIFASLNDREGATFKQIASLVEKYL